jgi:hypothetical protein
MGGDLYRDAHVGLRARIAELEARIEARASELTETFWDSLAPSLRERLAALRAADVLGSSARGTPDGDSLDELTRTEALLAAFLDDLEGLVATLPATEAEWAVLPDEVADPPEPRFTLPRFTPTDEEAAAIYRELRMVVRERDREAEIVDHGHMVLARFRDRGAPFALRATLYAQGNGQVSEVAMWLVTSIPRALPRLVVRHETLVLSVGKALGLKHEVEVGDTSFDGLFLIEGTKEAADRYLRTAVRAQLLALSHFDIPTLDVDPAARTASVLWRFEPAAKALDAAVRILTAVRESRPSVRFTND